MVAQRGCDRIEVLSPLRAESRLKSVSYIVCKTERRVSMLIVCGTALLANVVMIIAPRPAVIVIPLGIAVLDVKFAWARYFLGRPRVATSEQAAAARAGRADGYGSFRSGRN